LRESETALRKAFNTEKQRLRDEYNARVNHQKEMESLLRRSFDAEKDIITEAYSATINALSAQVGTAKERVGALASTINKLSSASQNFEKITRKTILESIMGVRGVAAQIASGDVSGLSRVDEYIRVLTANNTDLYSTAEAYRRDQAKSALALARLEDVSAGQLSIEEQTLSAIEKQIEIAEIQHLAELRKLDEQMNAIFAVDESTVSIRDAIELYEEAKAAVNSFQFDAQIQRLDAQLDALLGIDDSVQSLGSAIGSYTKANAAVVQNQISSGTSTASGDRNFVESLYQGMVGRAGDAEGVAYWMNELSRGVSPEKLIEDFRGAVLERGVMPKFANGGTHAGGIRMVGERGAEIEVTGGSRIMSNRALMDALGANRELLAEIRDMKAYIRQTTKNTGETRDRLNRWNVEGLPEEREAL
jgi:hypothetical protein